MTTNPEPELAPEIAHVLLMDVVGYSKLLVDEQIRVLQHLNKIVRNTIRFRSAEAESKLMRVPTGDGMALVFFDNPEAPLLCALEVAKEAKSQVGIDLRMGAHSGPVRTVLDVNDRANIAGAGIDIAQRVLDCGDAGHILLSKRLADDLRPYRHWNHYLHDLGECEVKHGIRLHVFNLCKDDVGNPAVPGKIQHQRRAFAKWRVPGARAAVSGRWRKAALAVAICALLVGSISAVRVLVKPSASTPNDPTRSASRPGAIERSIAVLPFGNLSDERVNAYFADGVQDEILRNLGKIGGLKVISRTSMMQYQPGPPRNVREIAEALGVAFVLEGNVQRVANRVRVSTQLIDARTDTTVWTNRYDRELANVFEIQSEIAEDIATQLKTKLSPEERAAIQDRPTSNLEAYDLYIRAKWLIDSSDFKARGQENLGEAAALLNDATARDPSFFLAYYQLAHAHDQIYLRFERTPARLALASAAISKLQALRPDSPEAHLALARHLYWGYLNYENARTEAERAQAGLPSDPLPSLILGYIARRQGRWDEALRDFNRALELDPRSAFILNQLGFAYCSLRRYPEMAQTLERAIALAPGEIFTRAQRALVDLEARADTRPLRELLDAFNLSHRNDATETAEHSYYLGLCERDTTRVKRSVDLLGTDGCFTEGVSLPREFCEGIAARLDGDEGKASSAFAAAVKASENYVRNQPQYGGAICGLALAHAAAGNKAEAIQHGRAAVELLPTEKDAVDGPLLQGYLAVVYGWTGEIDLAIEQLAAATSVPSYWSYGNLKLHPYWDPLRGDPRFEQIVASLAPK